MGVGKELSSFMGSVSSVADKADIKIGGFGLAAEVAGTTFGTKMRLADGEPFGEAFTKEIAENAKYGVAPYLIGFDIAKAGVEAYPALNKSAEMNYNMKRNYNFMGGDYVDTQQNYANRSRAMEQIKRNRVSISQDIGNEAKRFHR